MVLDELFGTDDPEKLSEDEILRKIAGEVFPPLKDNKNGSYYRWLVLKRFRKLEGRPPKRKEGEQYRTEDESRLDDALTQVAEANERSEMTIRSLCVHDVYDGEDQTGQFLQDLLEIERQFYETI